MNESYLSKDLSIDCHSDRYHFYLFYTFAMILIYPVGIPLFYFVLLWQHRSILSDPAKVEEEEAGGNQHTGHLLFLTDPYLPAAYYFESLECVRRLLLASVIGVVSENSAAAPVMGVIISLAFVRVIEMFRPYKSSQNNTLVTILAYSLVCIFLAALLIRVDVTSDDPGDQAVFGILCSGIFFAGPCFVIYQLVVFELCRPAGPKGSDPQGADAAEDMFALQASPPKHRLSTLPLGMSLDAKYAVSHSESKLSRELSIDRAAMPSKQPASLVAEDPTKIAPPPQAPKNSDSQGADAAQEMVALKQKKKAAPPKHRWSDLPLGTSLDSIPSFCVSE